MRTRPDRRSDIHITQPRTRTLTQTRSEKMSLTHLPRFALRAHTHTHTHCRTKTLLSNKKMLFFLQEHLLVSLSHTHTNHLPSFFHCILTEIPAAINHCCAACVRALYFCEYVCECVCGRYSKTHCQKFPCPYVCMHRIYICLSAHACVCVPSPLDSLLVLVCMVSVPTTAPMFAVVVVETSAPVC